MESSSLKTTSSAGLIAFVAEATGISESELIFIGKCSDGGSSEGDLAFTYSTDVEGTWASASLVHYIVLTGGKGHHATLLFEHANGTFEGTRNYSGAKGSGKDGATRLTTIGAIAQQMRPLPPCATQESTTTSSTTTTTTTTTTGLCVDQGLGDLTGLFTLDMPSAEGIVSIVSVASGIAETDLAFVGKISDDGGPEGAHLVINVITDTFGEWISDEPIHFLVLKAGRRRVDTVIFEYPDGAFHGQWDTSALKKRLSTLGGVIAITRPTPLCQSEPVYQESVLPYKQRREDENDEANIAQGSTEVKDAVIGTTVGIICLLLVVFALVLAHRKRRRSSSAALSFENDDIFG